MTRHHARRGSGHARHACGKAPVSAIWTRDTFGGILINDISVSLDAVLIMTFAAIALRHARARRIDVHRRWALRAIVPGPTPGSEDDMTGPTNIAIGFASYLLPLAVLELYLQARRSPSTRFQLATAVVVLAAAVATGVGVYGRTKGWLSS